MADSSVANRFWRSSSFGRSPGLEDRRVLMVEDEVIIAFSLGCEIEDAGGKVIGPAYTIDDARRLLDEPIDVAILDINLNGRSVWPIARPLHERGVLSVLASANYDDRRTIDPPYADVPCFDKPVTMLALIATVAELAA